MQEFIIKYQTLIGGALGPFLLGMGFWLKEKIKNYKDRKEFLRRIEISTTRSMDDIIKVREKLKDFIVRLQKLISNIRSITDEKHFSLETINFPTIREIFIDTEMPNFKVKSFYIHNKLLWMDSGIKEANEIVKNIQNDFRELLKKNELYVILLRQNIKPDAKKQRVDYSANLELFANATDDFLSNFINQGLEIMIQIKVYNEHLRKKWWGFWFRWKNEGTAFKFFLSKKRMEKFSKNLCLLDKVDDIIEKEVGDLKKEIQERVSKIKSF